MGSNGDKMHQVGDDKRLLLMKLKFTAQISVIKEPMNDLDNERCLN